MFRSRRLKHLIYLWFPVRIGWKKNEQFRRLLWWDSWQVGWTDVTTRTRIMGQIYGIWHLRIYLGDVASKIRKRSQK